MAFRLLGIKLGANRCDDVILEFDLASPVGTGGAVPLLPPSFFAASMFALASQSSSSTRAFCCFEEAGYESRLYYVGALIEPDQRIITEAFP